MLSIFSSASPLLLYIFLIASMAKHNAADHEQCSRVRFRTSCQNGENAKILLRYYLNYDHCVPYPVSFCKEHTDTMNRLFRTADECERSCLSKGTNARADNLRPLNLVKPLPPSPHNSVFQETNSADSFDLHRLVSRLQCDVPPDPGYCIENFEKWFYKYFNATSAQCERFTFTGCGGNSNNYHSQEECELSCKGTIGTECPRGTTPLVENGELYDCATKSCPPGFKCLNTTYRSYCCLDVFSQGAENENQTRWDAACEEDVDRGLCSRNELRFYFDRSLQECNYFFYSGCGGNRNNFERLNDCQRSCDGFKRWSQGKKVKSTKSDPKNGLEKKSVPGEADSANRLSPQLLLENHFAPSKSGDSIVGGRVVPSICLLPLVRGDCEEEEDRWYYNTAENQCEQFVYSGCGANSNNFATRADCTIVCAEGLSLNVCDHPIDEGNCTGNFTRWYFNNPDGRCEKFEYTGCGGNGNNFATHAECQETCIGHNAGGELFNTSMDNGCQLPLDVGYCNQQFIRWYFDVEINACTIFVYTGCGGNDNNFSSKEECEQLCPNGNSQGLADGSSEILPGTERPARGAKVEVTMSPLTSPTVETDQLTGLMTSAEPKPSTINPFVNEVRENGLMPFDNVAIKAVVLKINDASINYDIATQNGTELEDALVAIIAEGNSSAILKTEDGKTVTLDRKTVLEMSEILAQHIKADVAELEGVKQSELPSSLEVDMGPPLSPIHPVVKLSEREEAPSYKKCLEDLDVGLCNDAITRWYYDHKVRRCKPFTYRGCSGNRNHFYSNESCQEHCERFSDVIERSRIEPDADTYKAIDSTSTSVENFTEAPAESVSKEQWTSSVKPSGYSEYPFSPNKVAVEELPILESHTFHPQSYASFATSFPSRMFHNIQSAYRTSEGTIRSSRVPEIYGIASPMKRGYAQADVGLERVMLSSYPSEPQPALLSQVYFYPAEQLKGANSVMRNVRLCPIGEQPVKTADNNLIRCLPGQNHCPPNAVCYYYGLDFCCCSQSLVRPMARP